MRFKLIIGIYLLFGIRHHVYSATPPQFINLKSPNETYALVGSDAVFNCEASSHKSHKKAPVWMVDSVPVVGCLPTKFECNDKNSSNGYPVCISISKRCDALPDCPDGSDEDNCHASLCSEGLVSCNNKCVPEVASCKEVQCDWPDYMCIKDHSCIQSKRMCNNDSDCSDGTDEADCAGGKDFMVSRYKFNSQKTTLTIPDVKLFETLCVQCAISNDYGTAVGDECLTVIDKIQIHSQPNKTYNVSPGMTFALVSNATTDPFYAQQMQYSWYYYKEVNNETTGLTATKRIELPSKILETYFRPQDNNKLIKVRVPSDPHNNEDQFEVYKMLAGEPGEGREYSLIIKHPLDRYEFNFSMYGEEVLPPGKIHIHSQPNKTYNVSPGMIFGLVCNATTDPFYAQHMKYTWYYYIEVKNETTGLTATKRIELPSKILETYVMPYNNNKLIKVRVPSDPHNNEDQFEVYKMLAGDQGEGREYSLIISHPHARYEFNFSMYGEEVLPPGKIHIHSQPNKTYNVSPGMIFVLVSNATTDPFYAQQMQYNWYIYIEVKNETTGLTAIKRIELPSKILETYFMPFDNNKLITVRVPSDPHINEDQFEVYNMLAGDQGEGREYSLIISHPHDRYEFNFSMYGEEVFPHVIPQSPPNIWLIIGVIFGIIVVLLIAVAIVCMVCKRDPRGAYYVDKVERKAGNDPEQELKDIGFDNVGPIAADDDMDRP